MCVWFFFFLISLLSHTHTGHNDCLKCFILMLLNKSFALYEDCRIVGSTVDAKGINKTAKFPVLPSSSHGAYRYSFFLPLLVLPLKYNRLFSFDRI